MLTSGFLLFGPGEIRIVGFFFGGGGASGTLLSNRAP